MTDQPAQEHRAGDPVCRTLAGCEIFLDPDGFFLDADDWTEEICAELAAECGLTDICEDHWLVIRFLRKHYAYYGRAPLNKQLKDGCGKSLSEVERLFPGGIKNGARRLAGLPNPKSCV